MKNFHAIDAPTSKQVRARQQAKNHNFVDAGSIGEDDLALYWRKESGAAAKRLATRLGVRCVAGKYPWFAIWLAEGLANPPKSVWKSLQQPLLTTEEVAILLRCDARTIRRHAQNPPNSFPPTVFKNGRPWLWRPAQIYAYVSGRQVPQYRRIAPNTQRNMSSEKLTKDRGVPLSRPVFNPFSGQ